MNDNKPRTKNNNSQKFKPNNNKEGLEDFGKKVKDKYFKETYDDLLAIDKSEKIDKVFNNIEEFARYYANHLSTSQLRNIYARVVKAKDIKDLKILRPNLAYIAARQSYKVKEFVSFLDILIREVNEPEKLESFRKIMEAIVSYHKYYQKS